MNARRRWGLPIVVALWLVTGPPARLAAQTHGEAPTELTYDEALALAARRAPALVAARARAAEAARRIDAASVWPRNPRVSSAVGPRFEDSGTVVDASVEARQWLELGGQRGARVDAARAGADAADARAADARRRLLRDVGLAFVDAVYWYERRTLAVDDQRLAEGLARVAVEREAQGEVGGIEASVARVAAARAEAVVAAAEASHRSALGRLAALLGLDAEGLACRGALRALGVAAPAEERDAPDPGERADLRALRAEARQAEADGALARADRVPDVALGAGYVREEQTNLVRGTVAVDLPVFDRGQGRAAVAAARRDRIEAEVTAARGAAAQEIATARDVAARRAEAALRFEAAALGPLERAERLAGAGWEAGAVRLGEVLEVRRALVDARRHHVELLRDAAAARTELTAATGAWR